MGEEAQRSVLVRRRAGIEDSGPKEKQGVGRRVKGEERVRHIMNSDFL